MLRLVPLFWLAMIGIANACEAAPRNIDQPGSYCLQADIESIKITSSDVLLNLDGHCVKGGTHPDVTTIGVEISGERVQVFDGCVRGHYYGVLGNGVDIEILQLNISNSTFRGIRLGGRNLTAIDNIVRNIGGSTVHYSGYSMGIEFSNPNGDACRIADNFVSNIMPTKDTDGEGGAILFESECTVTNNVLMNSTYPVTGRTFGIWSGAAERMEVSGNLAIGFTYGFEAPSSHGNLAIDALCESYSHQPHSDVYQRTKKLPTCPDEIAFAARKADVNNPHAMFRIAQIHSRAHQSVMAMAYFILAARAGSQEGGRMVDIFSKGHSEEDNNLAYALAGSISKNGAWAIRN